MAAAVSFSPIAGAIVPAPNERVREPAEEKHGQVTQALRALGIRQILARSPQGAPAKRARLRHYPARRLPQELRLNYITDYTAAKRYLEKVFIADFNRRFTVPPAQKESAFTRLPAMSWNCCSPPAINELLATITPSASRGWRCNRPRPPSTSTTCGCPVLVHQFSNGRPGVSYQDRLLARYNSAGEPRAR